MTKIKTRRVTARQRLGLILILSLAVHALVFFQYNKTQSAAFVPNQAGGSFVVTLKEIQVPAKKQPESIAPKPDNNIAAIRPVTRQPASNEPGHVKDKKYIADNQPVAASSTRVISVINRQLEQHFYYPAIARKRNWQGKVTLGFKITRVGKVEDINVLESSGFEVLDLAAVAALNKLERLENNFDWPDNGMDVSLPVIYRLYEG